MPFKNLILTSLTLLALAGSSPAAPSPARTAPGATLAEPAPVSLEAFPRVDPTRLEDFRRALTLRLIDLLRDARFRALVASRVRPETTRLPLGALTRDWAETWPRPEADRARRRFQELDLDLRRTFGLEEADADLLALDLRWPEAGPRRLDWDQVLFAVRPRASAGAPAAIEAYDIQGRVRYLDPDCPPPVPVFLAGMDRARATRAGVDLVNRGLQAAGMSRHYRTHDPAAPIPCAKLTAVRLAPGTDAWWREGLDVYAIVSGLDPTEKKPNIRLVQMPYLTEPGTDYFPNQVLVTWKDYRFGAANVQLFDHGDGTNYQAILSAILKGAGAALVAVGQPAFAWIPTLADAILQSMPSTWWTDSDTWLDTFYTLEQGQLYLDQDGAGRMARISLAPWLLKPTQPG